MSHATRRYQSSDEDSARWVNFAARSGDIVISTRSKHGTTWMQMICALLVFQTPELPRPLVELSPWLDWLVTPENEVLAQLEAQRHRRIIKTHTPLDGIPLESEATYIVVARHPLDAAVSLYHQGDNLDRVRMRQMTGGARYDEMSARPALTDWLLSWIEQDLDPVINLDSFPGVMWHLSDAWARRDAQNIVLVHYDDLLADRGGEMRRISGRLGIEGSKDRWSSLVAAASFESMRQRAARLTPDPAGVIKDTAAFFRQGRSGSGRELLSGKQWDRYLDRSDQLAPPELLKWLHRGHR